MCEKSYVLITAARNEEAYIEQTIKSIISQTILPKSWVIVSDGSTDRTDDIVSQYATKYDFIELLRVEPNRNRDFGSKVNAIKAGYQRLGDTDYDFLGNLDADISFGQSYYEQVLAKMNQYPKLGIAGGVIFDICKGRQIKSLASLTSVGGQIQLFRRKCYEEIGGYMPLKIGGEDAAAEVMAQMHGWEVKSFLEIEVLHHRVTGTQGSSIYRARLRNGQEDYFLGYHPLFEISKCIYRISEKPNLVGSLLRMCGYYWCWCRRHKRQVGDDFVRYLRRQQIHRIARSLHRNQR